MRSEEENNWFTLHFIGTNFSNKIIGGGKPDCALTGFIIAKNTRILSLQRNFRGKKVQKKKKKEQEFHVSPDNPDDKLLSSWFTVPTFLGLSCLQNLRMAWLSLNSLSALTQSRPSSFFHLFILLFGVLPVALPREQSQGCLEFWWRTVQTILTKNGAVGAFFLRQKDYPLCNWEQNLGRLTIVWGVMEWTKRKEHSIILLSALNFSKDFFFWSILPEKGNLIRHNLCF